MMVLVANAIPVSGIICPCVCGSTCVRVMSSPSPPPPPCTTSSLKYTILIDPLIPSSMYSTLIYSVIGNTKLNLQIWDTAGQERFRSMAPMYYRGSSAAILAFDLTSEESFQEMKKWVTELQSRIEHDIILAIACCKVDLEAQRRVSKETVEAYAASIGAILQETSAKTNDGIEDLFLQLSRELIARHTDAYNTTDTQGNTGTRVEEVEPSKKKGCGC
eukprot:TRINITY_DN1124_c0_g4_i3.p1 TRINITY_DN1124_c0_g4~~TRINITY_DN1124_c0_g4_i3.p1  ORF type:complete len:218 (-),score=35.10 TRINITY_DN1124_c0_g4_i3:514-1167(-)